MQAGIFTAAVAPVALPSLQQPDLRKLQPLPLSSIKLEIEPDLKKLTPVPVTEKELSDGQAARLGLGWSRPTAK